MLGGTPSGAENDGQLSDIRREMKSERKSE
jgi:hypothetical protein